MGIFPVVAGWPTLLLQPQIALAAQWSIFTAVWYLDSTATRRGWAPKWYSTVSVIGISSGQATTNPGPAVPIRLDCRRRIFDPPHTRSVKLLPRCQHRQRRPQIER